MTITADGLPPQKYRNGDTVQKACEAIADSGFILNFIEYNTAFQRCLRYTMQMQC